MVFSLLQKGRVLAQDGEQPQQEQGEAHDGGPRVVYYIPDNGRMRKMPGVEIVQLPEEKRNGLTRDVRKIRIAGRWGWLVHSSDDHGDRAGIPRIHAVIGAGVSMMPSDTLKLARLRVHNRRSGGAHAGTGSDTKFGLHRRRIHCWIS